MSRCAVCHDDDDGTLKACPGCRTLAHEDCAKIRCPTIGCAGRPQHRPIEAAALATVGMMAYLSRRMRPIGQGRGLPFLNGGVAALLVFFAIQWTADYLRGPTAYLVEMPPRSTLVIGQEPPAIASTGSEPVVLSGTNDSRPGHLQIWNGRAWDTIATIDTDIPTRTTCQARKALSTVSGTATTFAAVVVPDDCTVSGTVYYEVQIKAPMPQTIGPRSGAWSPHTDISVASGSFNWNALNKQGVVCASAGATQEVSSCSFGTLRASSYANVSGKEAMLRIAPTWTCMVPTSVSLCWRIETPMPIKVEPR